MGDMIRVSDYIILDTKESKLSNAKHKNECRRVMEAHRGVEYLDKDRKHVSPKTFAGYILRYRINLFRLDSSERYIKNQIRHNYEQVSDVTLRKICMNIMDELDNRLYEIVKEERLLGFIDKLSESYKRLVIDDKHLLFPNGIYSLQDRSFDDKFETDALLTYQMGFMYDPDAECPEWKKALAKMFPDDTKAVISVIQEMMGYSCLYDSAPADTLFYLYGKGRNGKSIISFVLRKLHGEENIAAMPLAELGDRFSLSALLEKRVCICPENPQLKILDTSTLKALTGRDAVKVEKKYETPGTTVFNTKIIVNSNHYLRADDHSTGFWERILPIPFKVTFLPVKELVKKVKSRYFKERDTKLEKKLEGEMAGIFNWAMEGLMRLKDNGWAFTDSKSVAELKNEMILHCRPVLVFVTACVMQGNSDKRKGERDIIKSSDVHGRFLKWAENKGLEVSDCKDSRKFRKLFMESLEERGISAKIIKNSLDCYVGIKVSIIK